MDSSLMIFLAIVFIFLSFVVGFNAGEERGRWHKTDVEEPPKTRIRRCEILFVEPMGSFKNEDLKRVQSEVYEMMIAGCVVIPNGFSYTIKEVDMLVVDEDETVL